MGLGRGGVCRWWVIVPRPPGGGQGLVRARWDVSEAGRKRKYYALSAAGKRALAEQKEHWHVVHATLTNLWGTSHA